MPASAPIRRGALCAIALLALVQVVLPFRHFAEPGNVRWNEDGYYLSWRVMLTEKAGFVEFDVTDTGSGRTWTASPNIVLTDWQSAHVATRPDLIHATALLLEDQLLQDGPGRELEIRARAWVSMNGRAAALLLDPNVDLLSYNRGDLPKLAVLPMPAG